MVCMKGAVLVLLFPLCCFGRWNFEDKTELIVGAVLSLSGVAYDGSEILMGYRFWEEYTNSEGGVRIGDTRIPVRLVVLDNEGNLDRDEDLYKKLFQEDGADVLLGSLTSTVYGLSRISTELDVLTVSCCEGTAADFSAAQAPFLFGTGLDTSVQTLEFLRTVSAQGHTRIALLCGTGVEFLTSLCAATAQHAKDLGIDIVFERDYDPFTVTNEDFEGLLLEMIPTAPDILLGVSLALDSVAIVRAAASTNVLKGWEFFGGLLSPDYVESPFLKYLFLTVGPNRKTFVNSVGGYAERVLVPRQWDQTIPHSDPYFTSLEQLNELWKSRHDFGRGSPISEEAGLALAAGVVLRMGMEAAGEFDKTKIRDAMRAVDAETFVGRVKFSDAQHNEGEQPVVVQVDCHPERGSADACEELPVLPAGAGRAELRQLAQACGVGMLRWMERSTSGARAARCTPCWEADAASVRETLERGGESAGSLVASCPVFGSEIEVGVLFAEEDWEVLEAMRVALQTINAGLEVLPNVHLRFVLAQPPGPQEQLEAQSSSGAAGPDAGVLVWTTRGALHNDTVLQRWGVKQEAWEAEVETAGELLVSAGGRTVRMSPPWPLQAVGLAYLMQHMQWERCLLVTCAECGVMGQAFKGAAATMKISVEREVQLSRHQDLVVDAPQGGVRRLELTAAELAARAAELLALDDCEARVVVLLAGVEVAEAVVAAVRATGRAEQFVLLVNDAASYVQQPLHGMMGIKMSGEAAAVQERIVSWMWEDVHAHVHSAGHLGSGSMSLYDALQQEEAEAVEEEHAQDETSEDDDDAEALEDEYDEEEGGGPPEGHVMSTPQHFPLLQALDTVMLLGQLFEASLRADGGTGQRIEGGLLERLTDFNRLGLTGPLRFDEDLQRTAGRFQVVNFDEKLAGTGQPVNPVEGGGGWKVIAIWDAQDPSAMLHTESKQLSDREWLLQAVVWPGGQRPLDVCECVVWASVQGDANLFRCRWTDGALATGIAAAVLVLLVLGFGARRLCVSEFNDEEEREVNRMVLRLRKELGLTKDHGFVMARDRRGPGQCCARQYTLVQAKPLEALARMQMRLPFSVSDFDALCTFVHEQGESDAEGPSDQSERPANWRYAFVCSAVLDISQKLLDPAEHPSELAPRTGSLIAKWREPVMKMRRFSTAPDVFGAEEPQTQAERFAYFRDLVAKAQIWQDQDGMLFSELKASVQVFMDQLHEGFNERFKVMLSEEGGRDLAALRWDPEQAGRGSVWWDAMAIANCSIESPIAGARGRAEARLQQGEVQSNQSSEQEPEEALDSMLADLPELVRNEPERKPSLSLSHSLAEPASLSTLPPSAFFAAPLSSGAAAVSGAAVLRQDHLKVRAIRVDAEDLMEATMEYEMGVSRSLSKAGSSASGTASTVTQTPTHAMKQGRISEEVFISQLYRRATLLNDGFQDTIASFVEEHKEPEVQPESPPPFPGRRPSSSPTRSSRTIANAFALLRPRLGSNSTRAVPANRAGWNTDTPLQGSPVGSRVSLGSTAPRESTQARGSNSSRVREVLAKISGRRRGSDDSSQTRHTTVEVSLGIASNRDGANHGGEPSPGPARRERMRSRLVSQPEISGSASAEADEMRLAMAPDSHVAEATATSLPLPPPPEKDSSRSRSSAGKAARRDRDTFKLGRSRSERRGSDNSTWKRMLGRVGSFARAGLSRRASQESMGQLHPPAHKPPGRLLGSVQVLTAPVKTVERMREKLNEYATRPDACRPLTAHILDPIRVTICCEGPRDILTVLNWFLDNNSAQFSVPVIKIKNKFGMEDANDYDGYRDLMVNVLYTGYRGLRVIAEIQLHDRKLHQLKDKMHKLYKVKRAENAASI